MALFNVFYNGRGPCAFVSNKHGWLNIVILTRHCWVPRVEPYPQAAHSNCQFLTDKLLPSPLYVFFSLSLSPAPPLYPLPCSFLQYCKSSVMVCIYFHLSLIFRIIPAIALLACFRGECCCQEGEWEAAGWGFSVELSGCDISPESSRYSTKFRDHSALRSCRIHQLLWQGLLIGPAQWSKKTERRENRLTGALRAAVQTNITLECNALNAWKEQQLGWC